MKSKAESKKRKSHIPPGYHPSPRGRAGALYDWCQKIAEKWKAAGTQTNARYLSKIASGSGRSDAVFRALWDEPDAPRDLMRDKYGAVKA